IQVPFHPLFLSMSFVPIPTSHHYRYIFLCHFYHDMKHGNNNHRFQSLYTLFESILLRGQILTSIDRGERIYERHSASSPEHVAILPVHQTLRNGASCLILQYAQVSFGNCKADFYTPSCDVDSSSVAIVILRSPPPRWETYLHYNDLNDRLSDIAQHFPIQVYKHGHILNVLRYRQCTVQ